MVVCIRQFGGGPRVQAPLAASFVLLTASQPGLWRLELVAATAASRIGAALPSLAKQKGGSGQRALALARPEIASRLQVPCCLDIKLIQLSAGPI